MTRQREHDEPTSTWTSDPEAARLRNAQPAIAIKVTCSAAARHRDTANPHARGSGVVIVDWVFHEQDADRRAARLRPSRGSYPARSATRRCRHGRGADQDPERDEVPEQVPTIDLVVQKRELAHADRGQAGVGERRYDGEQRRDGRVAPSSSTPSPRSRRRRWRLRNRAEAVRRGAEQAAANDHRACDRALEGHSVLLTSARRPRSRCAAMSSRSPSGTPGRRRDAGDFPVLERERVVEQQEAAPYTSSSSAAPVTRTRRSGRRRTCGSRCYRGSRGTPFAGELVVSNVVDVLLQPFEDGVERVRPEGATARSDRNARRRPGSGTVRARRWRVVGDDERIVAPPLGKGRVAGLRDLDAVDPRRFGIAERSGNPRRGAPTPDELPISRISRTSGISAIRVIARLKRSRWISGGMRRSSPLVSATPTSVGGRAASQPKIAHKRPVRCPPCRPPRHTMTQRRLRCARSLATPTAAAPAWSRARTASWARI